MDIDKLMLDAVRDGIREGVKTKLGVSYQSPLDNLIKTVLEKNDAAFRSLMTSGIESAVNDPAFREEIRGAIRHKLANTLVARFGGELEKQVNALRSDPVTRAKITLAIEEIVKERGAT